MTSASGKPKAVIYARVSTRKQEEAGTIETQIDFIAHDPIVRVKFEIIPDHYLDDGISGYRKPLWQRPEGKRLLSNANDTGRAFDVVLVYKLNRLGRKMIDTEQAINELLNSGAVIYDVKNQMTIDNSSATGIMIRQFMGMMAEFERNNTVENVRDGLERKARNGQILPSTPRLGYNWSEVDERGHKVKSAELLIEDEERPLVQLIFDTYEKMPPSTESKWLNDNGYRLPRKVAAHRIATGETERMFTYKDVTSIVTDPIYTGTVEWGRTTKMKGRTPTPYSHHFTELQIISFEQFNRVQRLREQRRTLPAKSVASNYVYSGLIRCPECGGKTTGTKRHMKQYGLRKKIYVCRQHHVYGKSACLGWSALEETVNKAVIPFIVDLLEHKLDIKRCIEEEARNMGREEQESGIQRLQGQAHAAQSQLKNVQKMTVDGLMTHEEAKPFIYEARETIEKSSSQLAALEQRIEVRRNLSDAISSVCADLSGAFERLEPEILQAIVRQMFTKFTIDRKRGYRGNVTAWVDTYEFKEELKDLLVHDSTLDPHTSAYPCPRR